MDQRRRNVSDQAALPSMRPSLASSPTRPHIILVSSTPDSISKAPLSARPFGDVFGESPLAAGATESPFFPAEPGTSQRSGKEASPARPTERAVPYAPGDLEQALRRRRDWTPPPQPPPPPGDAPHHIHSDSSADCEAWSSPNAVMGGAGRASTAGNVFQTLHDSFRYQTDGALPPAQHVLGGSERTAAGAEAYLTRRKPLEPICLGDTGKAAAAKETTKTKTKTAKAKKPRTITELAVAAYADADPSLDSDDESARAGSRVASAKRPLEPDDAVAAAADEAAFIGLHERNLGLPNSRLRKLKKPATAKAKTKATDAPSTGAAAPKRKPATKRGQSKASGGGSGGNAGAAARRPRPPVLLSPRSALVESTAQDFLFGTSSQLAGDESPTFLRELQAAMQASNQDGSGGDNGSSYAAETEVSTVDLTGRAASSPAAAAAASRLWAVSARGHDGSVAFDTVVDLEEEIEFPEDPHEVLRAMAQQAKADAKDAAPPARKAETAEPRPVEVPAAEAASARSDSPLAPAPTPAATEQHTVEKRPPQRANEPSARPVADPGGASATTAQPPAAARSRPNFAVLTTAQLASKVASYGFKPMRARRAMLALLDQCWDASMSAGAGTGTGTGTGTQGLAPRTAAAPLSTKATAAASSRVVLEIADSESEGEAAVPDTASDAEDGDDAETAGSVADSDVSGGDEGAGGQGQAFGYITKAVLAARRTDDPSQPSWHEKMLMYDTILLEPFTAWLNEEGLRAAGYDTDAEGAVSALEVKRWCEAKSVCCTWRTNQNGKERKL